MTIRLKVLSQSAYEDQRFAMILECACAAAENTFSNSP